MFISSWAITVNISGNVKDMNNTPVANHWVVIEINDTTNFYQGIDSVQTNALGNYTYSLTNAGISMQNTSIISSRDCIGTQHMLYSYGVGGSGLDFQFCVNAIPNCDAQFTFYEDSLINGKYHFINQSVNYVGNAWMVNGSMASQQVNMTYTFSNQSTNVVYLEIYNTNPQCYDSIDKTVIVNYCTTSFTYNINSMSASFTANSSPTSNLYYWDFGDGNTQSTIINTVNHTYSNSGNYNVILKSYNIYAQDTCIAIDTQIVNISNPSPSGNLFGYVFTGNQYLDYGDIILYAKNPTSLKLIAIDTTFLIQDTSSNSKYYQFNNIPYGNYYIKCNIQPSSADYDNYISTWASQDANTQIVYWQDAELQVLNSNQKIANINLKQADIALNGGVSTISGIITNTIGINNSDQLVFLLNYDKKIVKAIHPQANGAFVFDSLIYGSYFLRPELTNYYSLEVPISLSGNTPNVSNVQISIDSNHYYTDINNIDARAISFSAYPNPVKNSLFVDISNIKFTDKYISIEVYNSLGALVYSEKINFYDNSTLEIPFNDKKNGLYIISLSDNYNIITKKIIKVGATN